MLPKICVYTRPVDPECYPEGLANSIHLAYCGEDGTKQPLNKNYGIMFAKGLISENNTIVPMGVRNPLIFAMPDGTIGFCAERIHENGQPDESMTGKLLLWKTKDLIHFDEEQIVDRGEIMQYHPAEFIECRESGDEEKHRDGADSGTNARIENRIARDVIRYWSPVFLEKIDIPERVTVAVGTTTTDEAAKPEAAETQAGLGKLPYLENIKARLVYSDGSIRYKKVHWDTEGIDSKDSNEFEIKGHICRQKFDFPLAKGYGDPVVFRWEGKWYYISTNDNLNDIGLYAREADDVHGLFADGVTEHLILPFDPDRGLEQTFWAPEFHVIGGELYILFAVSGHMWEPQCHMMRKKPGASIIDPDAWEDPVRVVRKDGRPLAEGPITLDMTYVKADSGSYVIWSYRENIGTPRDSGSMLYIAAIDEKEPWKLTSEPVLLTRPLYGWENVSGTINNEGPYAFIRDGKVYVTYSGGAANGYTYALGLLTAETGADLLDKRAWKKSITPVLTFYSVDGEYGPGHNSFFENEEGELMIAYHAETDIKEHLRCDGIRRVHFRYDGTPYFGMAAADDVGETQVGTILVRCSDM